MKIRTDTYKKLTAELAADGLTCHSTSYSVFDRAARRPVSEEWFRYGRIVELRNLGKGRWELRELGDGSREGWAKERQPADAPITRADALRLVAMIADEVAGDCNRRDRMKTKAKRMLGL